MRKQAQWKMVFVGTTTEVENELSKYAGRGYFTQVIPRVSLTLDGITEHYGLYVRKVLLVDLAAKAAKVSAR